MQRQPRTTPRKRPRQARSKATVDTILEATARVLVKHGFDGLSTNAVAAGAGVSIGSLYQYFQNKEALVLALIERHMEEMNTAILAELTRVAKLPLAEAARCVVELIQGYVGSLKIVQKPRDLLNRATALGKDRKSTAFVGHGFLQKLQDATKRSVGITLTKREPRNCSNSKAHGALDSRLTKYRFLIRVAVSRICC